MEQQEEIVPNITDDDEAYAQELQFQQTLADSLITSTPPPPPPPQPSPSLLCVASSSSKPVDVAIILNVEKIKLETNEESNESSSSSIIICEICAETKKTEEMFNNQSCSHSFCSECVIKQVETKIHEKIANVSCPGLNCKGVLELESCISLLPKELIDKWNDALCEALFCSVPKFYCPFKDCSAMLLDENEGVEDIRESECPFCHRLFCASCHVPWHPGIGCEEYQKLNVDERGSDDLVVRELANQKQWRRCPTCKFYVEKNGGCLHITCRCRFEFCYACGEQWSSTHGGCQKN
ncbi:E3 ubiquitin-protein ligase RSL1-like isoform X1 [Trifolium pratense]|uniref:E3 ubiquitin-protein ligase RSL1-like isoform X1 n=1 Tax=Trifolium pratense TaxID=57577 RepID=UPI001E692767|nr:E3 ubiquitin-protein ligase RSL1-like isoform X1 [Trifolium pratense]